MRQFQRQIVPDGMAVHPIVRWIWRQINAQRASQEDIAARSGVSSSAMRKWRRGNRSPRLADVEAVINCLGFKLVVIPKGDNEL